MTAEYPTNIPIAVDRKAIPFGSARPQELAKHLLMTRGVRFVYQAQQ